MPLLTANACKAAQPREKNWKLSDAGGLYLLVMKSGSKSWRWKYRFEGKEKQLSLGLFPQVSLKEARDSRDRARMLKASGTDPSAAKKLASSVAAKDPLDSFEQVARAWHKTRVEVLTPRYAGQILDRLEADAFPEIGPLSISSITPPIMLAAIRKIEDRGAREMAHRVRMHCSDIFVWAISSGIAEQDPAATIRKALLPTNSKLRPAATRIAGARSVIERTEKLPKVYWATRLASRLLALTAARPGVIRMAEPSEFEDLDSDKPVWRIPADKMKLTRERKRDAAFEFVIPLSSQAAATVKAAASINSGSQWLFPGIGNKRKPISDSTLSKHYRDAGFTGVHVPHGWRASFSTIMNERAAVEERETDRAIIDLMLAHVQEGVEAAYNRAAYMPRRRELAQAWADMLMEGIAPPEAHLPG